MDAKGTLLDDVVDIALLAGDELMRRYGNANISVKSDGSQVTDADLAAEAIILPALRNLTPDVPIVSEEQVAAGIIPDLSCGTFWTVDPLDGTRDFIEQTGSFMVAIALIVNGRPVLGVMHHPAFDVLYAGGDGQAFKLTKAAPPVPLRVRAAPEQPLRALINARIGDMDKVQPFLRKRYGAGVQLDTSSGIFRACRLAEGLADLSLVCPVHRQGRTFWWDVAPGHAIVEAAGGQVQKFDGQPALYQDDDLQIGPVIMSASQF